MTTAYEIAHEHPDIAIDLKKKIKEQEEQLREHKEVERKLKDFYINTLQKPHLLDTLAYDLSLLSNRKDYVTRSFSQYSEQVSLEKLIKFNKQVLTFIELQKKPRATRVKDFHNKMQRAKQVPIDSLLEFNKAGFTHCIWHSENTPSMKYDRQNNRTYCFGCHKHGDAIDVMQVIQGKNFKEAVEALSGM